MGQGDRASAEPVADVARQFGGGGRSGPVRAEQPGFAAGVLRADRQWRIVNAALGLLLALSVVPIWL
jgi:hypothetical protein